MLTDDEIAELRELAKAVTQGPWEAHEDMFGPLVGGKNETVVCRMDWPDDTRRDRRHPNAAYIVAVQPSCVVSLLDTIEALRPVEAAARRLAARQSGDYQSYLDEQRAALVDLRAALAAHDAGRR